MQVGDHAHQDTVHALSAWLSRAGSEDDAAERLAKNAGIRAALFGAGLFLSLFLMAITPYLGLLTLGLAVGLVVSLVQRFRHKRHDLDDRKLEAATRLLKVLRADIPADQEVFLRVDFRGYRAGGKRIAHEAAFFSNLKMSRYEHDWFELRAPLADGSQVALAVTDEVSRKEKVKRKQNKVRERTTSEVSLSLRLDKRYGDAAAVLDRLKAITPPNPLRLKRAAHSQRTVRAVFEAPPALVLSGRVSSVSGQENLTTGDTLLRVLRWAYGALAPTSRAA